MVKFYHMTDLQTAKADQEPVKNCPAESEGKAMARSVQPDTVYRRPPLGGELTLDFDVEIHKKVINSFL